MYAPTTGARRLDCSDETARDIDSEVMQLLAAAYNDAREVLEAHRDELEIVTHELLRRETLDEAEFRRLIGHDEETGSAPRNT